MLGGGNSVWANFLASVVGALMYFATLSEVPILQGLSAPAWERAALHASCRPRAVAAKHDRYSERAGYEKDFVFFGLVIVLFNLWRVFCFGGLVE
jgi:cbb3-type cytochrome oxidase subunit 1